MASAQDWGSAAYPPPPPPTTVIVPNPYLQPQYAAVTVPPFPPQHYPGPSQTSVYIGPGVTGGSSIDHAFARSGRDLSLSAGVFLLITCALAIVGVVSPWVSGPVTVNGVLLPIQECSFSIGLIYVGFYGDKCPSDRPPKYGTVTIAAYTGSTFGSIVAGTGQFAAAALSLGVILASVATAAGFVACKRYSKSSLEPVTPKHFGTAAVLVGLSATIFTMCVVGVVVGDLWLGANPFNYFDGGGRLAADAAIGTSLIAMVLSIVLKFKTRGVAKSSAPEL